MSEIDDPRRSSTIARWSLTAVVAIVAIAAALWFTRQENSPETANDSPGDETSVHDVSSEKMEIPEERTEIVIESPPDLEIPGEQAGGRSDSDKADELRVIARTEAGELLESIPINLEMSLRNNRGFRRSEYSTKTDEDGVATIPAHEITKYADAPPPPDGGEEVMLEIACGIPLDPRVAIEATTALVDRGACELVLPNSIEEWLKLLSVRVVDVSGDPVGDVPVELEVAAFGSGSSDLRLETRETDANGRVDLSYDGIWEKEMQFTGLGLSALGASRGDQAGRYRVFCDIPLKDGPSADVPIKPPTDPIELMLPPMGKIEVEILDHQGNLVQSEASVGLHWRDPSIASERIHFQRSPANGRETSNGIATYDAVGFDLEFIATASVADKSSSAGSTTFLGPVRSQTTARVQVRLNPPQPMIVGRLVDTEGNALQSQYVVVEFWQLPLEGPKDLKRPKPGWATLTTDSEGRFEHHIQASIPDDQVRHVRFLEKSSPGGKFVHNARWSRRDLPQRLAAGEKYELGDVVFEPIPILVAGRVVDIDGNPLPSAYVNLQLSYGPEDRRQWSVAYGNVTCDDEGRFEIRYPGDFEVVKLWGRISPHFWGETMPVRAGSTNAILLLRDTRKKLEQRGKISGRLLLDPEIPFFEMHVRIRSERNRRDREVGPLGSFGLEDAYPEVVTLEAQTQSTNWVIDRIEDVKVRAGEKVDDPRVLEWDLRGKIRRLLLKIETDDGRPLIETRVSIDDERGKGGWKKTDSEGNLLLYVPERALTYTLSAPEFGYATFRWNEPEGQSIRLKQR